MRALVSALAAVVLAALTAGCTAGVVIAPSTLVAVPGQPVHRSRESVSVAVSGGKKVSPLGLPTISDEVFAQALRESIEKAGLFTRAVDGEGAPYRLQAFIGRVQQPFMGGAMHVVFEVSYALLDRGARKVVWQRSIATEHTEPASTTFAAATRLQLATEAAARANIEQVIAEIGRLELP